MSYGYSSTRRSIWSASWPEVRNHYERVKSDRQAREDGGSCVFAWLGAFRVAKFSWDTQVNKTLLWIAAAATAVVAVVAAALYLTRKPALHGAVIDPPMQAAEIRLTDINGAPFLLSNLRGKAVLLYFGYTNCPDQCPLTMAHLKTAVDMLGDKAAGVRVVMITTDPARDTSQALKDFLGKFNPDFIGLVGTPADLAQVWHDYGVAVENGGETHSNYIYVLDRAGRLRETFLPDTLPVDESADLKLILGG
jgi:protein SCO1